jgi:MoxR-like ATPase
MAYVKTFDPAIQDTGATTTPVRKRRDGDVYIYDDKTAPATGRPLLICGVPGLGKSSLAPYVSKCLKWRFYQQVISSRTQARDSIWSFDAVHRLNDRQVNDKPATQA